MLSGGYHRLGESSNAVMEVVKHNGYYTFCLDTLHEAIDRYGTPEIFNSDQGSQFTSEEFTNSLISNGIKISMDGKEKLKIVLFF